MRDTDTFFERLKRNPLLRLLYKLPVADKLYHLSLALLGAVIYGFPSRQIKVIGITGTKGKTTSVELLAHILESAGHKTALLSSVSIKTGMDRERNRKSNSMPGRMFIQRFLKQAAKNGCEYAVIEVTSLGVVLSRHRFIRWVVAGVTNIAPEHIEAHGSFENYRASKLSFLAGAARQGGRVFVNAGDKPSEFFTNHLPAAATEKYSTEGLPHLELDVEKTLPGRFNLENIALCRGVALSLGIPEKDFWAALRSFSGVPGRAEFIQREPFTLVVDYAHTPDSLRAIYETAREGLQGRLIGVFGSAGGGRDKWKRPEMGKIAAKYCDEIILTDEDPYDENPKDILAQISTGFGSGTRFTEILDRGEAIREAVRRAKPGDAIVVTGKGSELSIHLAHGQVVDWSDREEAEKALAGK